MLTPLEEIAEEDTGSFAPHVSIVIPAFNEEARIAKTLFEWTEFLGKHYSRNYEILVIMDGCTDHTVDLVSQIAEGKNAIIPIICPKRLGKGGALIEAFRQFRREILFFTDADGSLPPSEFLKFMHSIRKCELAIGSRYFRGSDFVRDLPLSRLMASRIFNVLLKFVFPELRSIYDSQCGAKAIRRKVIDALGDDLFVTDFSFDVNLIYSAMRSGFRVEEIGIEYNHVENESKISGNLLKISCAMLLSIIRLRLFYSKLRRFTRTSRLKGLIGFLMKWLNEDSLA